MRLRQSLISSLAKKVAHSLFLNDFLSICSEKAELLIVLAGRRERCSEPARIIDLETLRIAAGRRGRNRKGYSLRLVT
jgi:hypothetical protein